MAAFYSDDSAKDVNRARSTLKYSCNIDTSVCQVCSRESTFDTLFGKQYDLPTGRLKVLELRLYQPSEPMQGINPLDFCVF